MAVTGAAIVLIGLAVLSFIISQLPKFLFLIEGSKKSSQPLEKDRPDHEAEKLEHLITDIDSVVKLYEPVVKKMDQPFQLNRLYELSEQNNFPHTHLTIKMLREAGILVPAGDGAFNWSK